MACAAHYQALMHVFSFEDLSFVAAAQSQFTLSNFHIFFAEKLVKSFFSHEIDPTLRRRPNLSIFLRFDVFITFAERSMFIFGRHNMQSFARILSC